MASSANLSSAHSASLPSTCSPDSRKPALARLQRHHPQSRPLRRRNLRPRRCRSLGAVFGIAGILIVLLSNHKLPIPWSELKRLRRSVIQFASLNLVIGIAANYTSFVNIDNRAHLGGFLCGLALGVPLVPRMTSGRIRYLSRQKITFAGFTFLLVLFGYFIATLSKVR